MNKKELLSTLIFILLFLSGCDSKGSSNHFFGYKKFKCKEKTVTSYYPMKLYTFKYTYNEDFYSKMTPYSIEPVDLQGDDHIYVEKIYPAFEKFKILKYYSHCSFGNGCYGDYLIQDQSGLVAWLSSANFSSYNCQISGSDFWLDMESNATERYDAEKIDKPYSNKGINIYSNYNSYLNSKKFIEHFIQENNAKLKNKKEDKNITITLPTRKIYQLSSFIYVEKVLKNFYPKNTKVYMNLSYQDIPYPKFEYTINKKTYLKTPYNCKEVSSKAPFACFKNFDKWLSKPYSCNHKVCFGNIKYDFKKGKLHLLAVFNYKYLDIGMFFDNLRYLERLKEENIKIYTADIGYKGLQKEGIYLINDNFGTQYEFYFNSESVYKIINRKSSIEQLETKQ